MDKADVLAENYLFKDIPRDEIVELVERAPIIKRQPNSVIFKKGDPGESMMAVLSGRVRICCYSAEGKELTLNIIGPGECFGEIALLDGESRTADAVSMEPTELLVVSRQDFIPWLEERPKVCMHMMVVLSHRLRRTSAQLEDTLLYEAPFRLARCLIRLSNSFGKPHEGGTIIDLKLSQQRLGTLVGLTRESTNKCLIEWQRDKIIDRVSGKIVILDREALILLGGDEDENAWNQEF